ncbi:MAG: YciI family protein [Leptospirales bacterium]
MTKTKIAFFYFMKSEIENLKNIIEEHVNYWHNANLVEYKGGPFSDRSGGLILFSIGSMEEALDIINNDPFITKNCLEKKWIKEWM